MQIPDTYWQEAQNQGSLVELNYTTYESMSYDAKSETLEKRAVVYIPYGYSEDQKYNVFYLMHGGWSDETTYLGTPDRPSEYKNVLDHAMEDGVMEPIVVVCPTYNNTSGEDSGNYSLAIQLTDNYHNELINDLIPAVELQYSTYLTGSTKDEIKASRDHRAFCGFSMGSVATWRTFQYCLDYFRYFMPSSGNLTTDGEYMASIVENAGYDWNDFFIFAASGTDDFAYLAFYRQIQAMADVDDVFKVADNETDGNLYFLEEEGATHNGNAAMLYFYNGMCWIWNS
ncbi:MAG: alpha/beta hydrolase-fold protein [Lachnospiraceae bacterium]|nr:alpha/beta hydrolase-fold protein [Lachnospiraceae bacterium]